MQNSCKCSSQRKYLVCEFPPCSCKKCQRLRCEAAVRASKNLNDCLNSDNIKSAGKACSKGAEEEDKPLEGKFTQISNLSDTSFSMDAILFDIIGITAFIIMATIMFWLTVIKYLWRFTKLAIESERRVKLITFFLLLLLICSIIFHSFQGSRNRMLQAQQKSLKNIRPLKNRNATLSNAPHQICCQRKKCSLKKFKDSPECLRNSNLKKSTSTGGNKQIPPLCNLCAKKLKNNLRSNNVMNDDKIREMYMKFKLYSIPSEMKSPPSADNLIGFLSTLYNGISEFLANTFH